MIDFAAQRTKMVESQIRTEDVTDRNVIAAMAAVAREKFVPERMAELAYIDQDLAIAGMGMGGRFLMKPATLARLLQAAGVAPTDRALDVGCGLGYAAAAWEGPGATVDNAFFLLGRARQLESWLREQASRARNEVRLFADGALIAGLGVEAGSPADARVAPEPQVTLRGRGLRL